MSKRPCRDFAPRTPPESPSTRAASYDEPSTSSGPATWPSIDSVSTRWFCAETDAVSWVRRWCTEHDHRPSFDSASFSSFSALSSSTCCSSVSSSASSFSSSSFSSSSSSSSSSFSSSSSPSSLHPSFSSTTIASSTTTASSSTRFSSFSSSSSCPLSHTSAFATSSTDTSSGDKRVVTYHRYGFAGGTLLYLPPGYESKRITDSDLRRLPPSSIPALLAIVKGPTGRLGWPGGKPSPGERPHETARREVQEEIGQVIPFLEHSTSLVEVQLFPSGGDSRRGYRFRCHTSHVFCHVVRAYSVFTDTVLKATSYVLSTPRREVIGVAALPIHVSDDARSGLAHVLHRLCGGWEERVGQNDLLRHPGSRRFPNPGRGWDLLLLLLRLGVLNKRNMEFLLADSRIGLDSIYDDWTLFVPRT